MPVKRHIFINRDSHPDANIYMAVHEAKNLPPQVPDYQVPHCHNTDEFYYFIGDHPDLTGLEGRSSSKAGCTGSFRPPVTHSDRRGAWYRVTKGGTDVLFRNRGYTHGPPFNLGGERDFANHAGYIFHPSATNE